MYIIYTYIRPKKYLNIVFVWINNSGSSCYEKQYLEAIKQVSSIFAFQFLHLKTETRETGQVIPMHCF